MDTEVDGCHCVFLVLSGHGLQPPSAGLAAAGFAGVAWPAQRPQVVVGVGVGDAQGDKPAAANRVVVGYLR
jgi:hypothetical protein